MLIVLAAVAFVWGLCSLLVIDWDHAPPILIHLSVTARPGDHRRGGRRVRRIPLARVDLPVLRRRVRRVLLPASRGIRYLGACVVANALVLAYDDRATGGTSVAQFVIASAAFVAIGGSDHGRQAAARGLPRAGRAARGRAGRAAPSGDGGGRGPPEAEIYQLVAREAAALLGAGAAGIIRFDGDSEATVMGSWADHEGGRYPPGTVIPVLPGTDVAAARDSGAPVRIERHPPDSPVGRLGYTASIVSPVRVDGRSWGALAVTAAARCG